MLLGASRVRWRVSELSTFRLVPLPLTIQTRPLTVRSVQLSATGDVNSEHADDRCLTVVYD